MSYHSVVLADSPVSYWRLDETSGTNAADQQGANAGTYTGTFTLNVAGALVGSGDSDTAVSLAGTGYIAASGYTPFVGGASQTFEGWANTSSPSGHPVFGGSGGSGPSLWFDTATNLSWYPQNSSASSWASAWPGDGVWVYFALTWNDSTKTAELFINGVSKGAVVCTQAYATTGTLQMGALHSTDILTGSLDEFAVYSSILSATQIATHYAAGVPLAVTGGFLSLL